MNIKLLILCILTTFSIVPRDSGTLVPSRDVIKEKADKLLKLTDSLENSEGLDRASKIALYGKTAKETYDLITLFKEKFIGEDGWCYPKNPYSLETKDREVFYNRQTCNHNTRDYEFTGESVEGDLEVERYCVKYPETPGCYKENAWGQCFCRDFRKTYKARLEGGNCDC